MVQAVVTPEGKAPEGVIVQAVGVIWTEYANLLRADPCAAFRIDDRRWEELVAGWYDMAGYDEVILTPRSGDFGRDVIAIKRGYVKIRIIDQVKALGPGKKVDLHDVDALIGTLHREAGTSKGVVTTTADFAPRLLQAPGINEPIPNRLELINGAELVRRLVEVAERPIFL